MKTRTLIPVLTMAALVVGALALLGSSPAEAQCLSQSECDALKAQIEDYRDQARPDREQIREIRRQVRELPRGSDERKTLRGQARELRREFRHDRRDSGIREVMRAYRDGCKRC